MRNLKVILASVFVLIALGTAQDSSAQGRRGGGQNQYGNNNGYGDNQGYQNDNDQNRGNGYNNGYDNNYRNGNGYGDRNHRHNRRHMRRYMRNHGACMACHPNARRHARHNRGCGGTTVIYRGR